MRMCRIMILLSLVVFLGGDRPAPSQDQKKEQPRFVDLSLLVAPEYPCTWPTFPKFQINHYERIGPLSPYNSDILIIDGNTGTQLDVPPHSVTLPDSGLPNAGKFGGAFTDKIEAWQFGGETCVIDCRDLIDSAPKGRSDLSLGHASRHGRRSIDRWGRATWCCSTVDTPTSS